MTLIVSAGALDDIQRLYKFLAARDSPSAYRALAVLEQAIDSISVFPQRGRPSGVPGVRELIVSFGQAAYIVRYAQDQARDEVVILRLWHSREERL